jgi:hypothetical protein
MEETPREKRYVLHLQSTALPNLGVAGSNAVSRFIFQ